MDELLAIEALGRFASNSEEGDAIRKTKRRFLSKYVHSMEEKSQTIHRKRCGHVQQVFEALSRRRKRVNLEGGKSCFQTSENCSESGVNVAAALCSPAAVYFRSIFSPSLLKSDPAGPQNYLLEIFKNMPSLNGPLTGTTLARPGQQQGGEMFAAFNLEILRHFREVCNDIVRREDNGVHNREGTMLQLPALESLVAMSVYNRKLSDLLETVVVFLQLHGRQQAADGTSSVKFPPDSTIHGQIGLFLDVVSKLQQATLSPLGQGGKSAVLAGSFVHTRGWVALDDVCLSGGTDQSTGDPDNTSLETIAGTTEKEPQNKLPLNAVPLMEPAIGIGGKEEQNVDNMLLNDGSGSNELPVTPSTKEKCSVGGKVLQDDPSSVNFKARSAILTSRIPQTVEFSVKEADMAVLSGDTKSRWIELCKCHDEKTFACVEVPLPKKEAVAQDNTQSRSSVGNAEDLPQRNVAASGSRNSNGASGTDLEGRLVVKAEDIASGKTCWESSMYPKEPGVYRFRFLVSDATEMEKIKEKEGDLSSSTAIAAPPPVVCRGMSSPVTYLGCFCKIALDSAKGFMYVVTECGLAKIGTGFNNSVTGHMYMKNVHLFTPPNVVIRPGLFKAVWLCFCEGRLLLFWQQTDILLFTEIDAFTLEAQGIFLPFNDNVVVEEGNAKTAVSNLVAKDILSVFTDGSRILIAQNSAIETGVEITIFKVGKMKRSLGIAIHEPTATPTVGYHFAWMRCVSLWSPLAVGPTWNSERGMQVEVEGQGNFMKDLTLDFDAVVCDCNDSGKDLNMQSRSAGRVSSWKFIGVKAGRVTLCVWRKTTKMTYELVGKNCFYAVKGNQCVEIAYQDQIAIECGDTIGVSKDSLHILSVEKRESGAECKTRILATGGGGKLGSDQNDSSDVKFSNTGSSKKFRWEIGCIRTFANNVELDKVGSVHVNALVTVEGEKNTGNDTVPWSNGSRSLYTPWKAAFSSQNLRFYCNSDDICVCDSQISSNDARTKEGASNSPSNKPLSVDRSYATFSLTTGQFRMQDSLKELFANTTGESRKIPAWLLVGGENAGISVLQGHSLVGDLCYDSQHNLIWFVNEDCEAPPRKSSSINFFSFRNTFKKPLPSTLGKTGLFLDANNEGVGDGGGISLRRVCRTLVKSIAKAVLTCPTVQNTKHANPLDKEIKKIIENHAIEGNINHSSSLFNLQSGVAKTTDSDFLSSGVDSPEICEQQLSKSCAPSLFKLQHNNAALETLLQILQELQREAQLSLSAVKSNVAGTDEDKMCAIASVTSSLEEMAWVLHVVHSLFLDLRVSNTNISSFKGTTFVELRQLLFVVIEDICLDACQFTDDPQDMVAVPLHVACVDAQTAAIAVLKVSFHHLFPNGNDIGTLIRKTVQTYSNTEAHAYQEFEILSCLSTPWTLTRLVHSVTLPKLFHLLGDIIHLSCEQRIEVLNRTDLLPTTQLHGSPQSHTKSCVHFPIDPSVMLRFFALLQAEVLSMAFEQMSDVQVVSELYEYACGLVNSCTAVIEAEISWLDSHLQQQQNNSSSDGIGESGKQERKPSDASYFQAGEIICNTIVGRLLPTLLATIGALPELTQKPLGNYGFEQNSGSSPPRHGNSSTGRSGGRSGDGPNVEESGGGHGGTENRALVEEVPGSQGIKSLLSKIHLLLGSLQSLKVLHQKQDRQTQPETTLGSFKDTEIRGRFEIMAHKFKYLESPHPYPPHYEEKATICIEGASSLSLNFDKRFHTEDRDTLYVYEGDAEIESRKAGLFNSKNYGQGLTLQGNSVTFGFKAWNRSSNSNNRWGYRVQIAGCVSHFLTMGELFEAIEHSIILTSGKMISALICPPLNVWAGQSALHNTTSTSMEVGASVLAAAVDTNTQTAQTEVDNTTASVAETPVSNEVGDGGSGGVPATDIDTLANGENPPLQLDSARQETSALLLSHHAWIMSDLFSGGLHNATEAAATPAQAENSGTIVDIDMEKREFIRGLIEGGNSTPSAGCKADKDAPGIYKAERATFAAILQHSCLLDTAIAFAESSSSSSASLLPSGRAAGIALASHQIFRSQNTHFVMFNGMPEELKNVILIAKRVRQHIRSAKDEVVRHTQCTASEAYLSLSTSVEQKARFLLELAPASNASIERSAVEFDRQSGQRLPKDKSRPTLSRSTSTSTGFSEDPFERHRQNPAHNISFMNEQPRSISKLWLLWHRMQAKRRSEREASLPELALKFVTGSTVNISVLKKQLLAHKRKAENAIAGYQLLRSFFGQPMVLDEDLQIALLIPFASSLKHQENHFSACGMELLQKVDKAFAGFVSVLVPHLQDQSKALPLFLKIWSYANRPRDPALPTRVDIFARLRNLLHLSPTSKLASTKQSIGLPPDAQEARRRSMNEMVWQCFSLLATATLLSDFPKVAPPLLQIIIEDLSLCLGKLNGTHRNSHSEKMALRLLSLLLSTSPSRTVQHCLSQPEPFWVLLCLLSEGSNQVVQAVVRLFQILLPMAPPEHWSAIISMEPQIHAKHNEMQERAAVPLKPKSSFSLKPFASNVSTALERSLSSSKLILSNEKTDPDSSNSNDNVTNEDEACMYSDPDLRPVPLIRSHTMPERSNYKNIPENETPLKCPHRIRQAIVTFIFGQVGNHLCTTQNTKGGFFLLHPWLQSLSQRTTRPRRSCRGVGSSQEALYSESKLNRNDDISSESSVSNTMTSEFVILIRRLSEEKSWRQSLVNACTACLEAATPLFGENCDKTVNGHNIIHHHKYAGAAAAVLCVLGGSRVSHYIGAIANWKASRGEASLPKRVVILEEQPLFFKIIDHDSAKGRSGSSLRQFASDDILKTRLVPKEEIQLVDQCSLQAPAPFLPITGETAVFFMEALKWKTPTLRGTGDGGSLPLPLLQLELQSMAVRTLSVLLQCPIVRQNVFQDSIQLVDCILGFSLRENPVIPRTIFVKEVTVEEVGKGQSQLVREKKNGKVKKKWTPASAKVVLVEADTISVLSESSLAKTGAPEDLNKDDAKCSSTVEDDGAGEESASVVASLPQSHVEFEAREWINGTMCPLSSLEQTSKVLLGVVASSYLTIEASLVASITKENKNPGDPFPEPPTSIVPILNSNPSQDCVGKSQATSFSRSALQAMHADFMSAYSDLLGTAGPIAWAPFADLDTLLVDLWNFEGRVTHATPYIMTKRELMEGLLGGSDNSADGSISKSDVKSTSWVVLFDLISELGHRQLERKAESDAAEDCYDIHDLFYFVILFHTNRLYREYAMSKLQTGTLLASAAEVPMSAQTRVADSEFPLLPQCRVSKPLLLQFRGRYDDLHTRFHKSQLLLSFPFQPKFVGKAVLLNCPTCSMPQGAKPNSIGSQPMSASVLATAHLKVIVLEDLVAPQHDFMLSPLPKNESTGSIFMFMVSTTFTSILDKIASAHPTKVHSKKGEHKEHRHLHIFLSLLDHFRTTQNMVGAIVQWKHVFDLLQDMGGVAEIRNSGVGAILKVAPPLLGIDGRDEAYISITSQALTARLASPMNNLRANSSQSAMQVCQPTRDCVQTNILPALQNTPGILQLQHPSDDRLHTPSLIYTSDKYLEESSIGVTDKILQFFGISATSSGQISRTCGDITDIVQSQLNLDGFAPKDRLEAMPNHLPEENVTNNGTMEQCVCLSKSVTVPSVEYGHILLGNPSNPKRTRRYCVVPEHWVAKKLQEMTPPPVEGKDDSGILVPKLEQGGVEVKTCPHGHKLRDYRVPNSTFRCDQCGIQLAIGASTQACRICNWDLCEGCCASGLSLPTLTKSSGGESSGSGNGSEVVRLPMPRLSVSMWIQREEEQLPVSTAEEPTKLFSHKLTKTTIFSKGLPSKVIESSMSPFLYFKKGDHRLYVSVKRDKTAAVKLQSSTEFHVGKWCHVCLVIDNLQCFLYVNGRREDQNRGKMGFAVQIADGHYYIGDPPQDLAVGNLTQETTTRSCPPPLHPFTLKYLCVRANALLPPQVLEDMCSPRTDALTYQGGLYLSMDEFECEIKTKLLNAPSVMAAAETPKPCHRWCEQLSMNADYDADGFRAKSAVAAPVDAESSFFRCMSPHLALTKATVYFEVTLDRLPMGCVCCIGLYREEKAIPGRKRIRHVGFESGSLAYHSSGAIVGDPFILSMRSPTSPLPTARGLAPRTCLLQQVPPLKKGDVVGFGINRHMDVLYITKNGRRVTTSSDMKNRLLPTGECSASNFYQRFFPCITAGYGVAVSANFGQKEYVYTGTGMELGESLEKKEAIVTPRKISNCTGTAPSPSVFSPGAIHLDENGDVKSGWVQKRHRAIPGTSFFENASTGEISMAVAEGSTKANVAGTPQKGTPQTEKEDSGDSSTGDKSLLNKNDSKAGVKVVAIIGAGELGCDIAAELSMSGLHVTIFDSAPHRRDGSIAAVLESLARYVKDGLLLEKDAVGVTGRITIAASLENTLKSADIIIEASCENLQEKKSTYKKIEELCTLKNDDVLIFCSNNHLVDTVANTMEKPQRLVGVRFVDPVILMPQVELKPSLKTDPETVSRAFRWFESIGKQVAIAPTKPSYFTKAQAYSRQKKTSYDKYGGYIGISSQRIVSHCFNALTFYPSVWNALGFVLPKMPTVVVDGVLGSSGVDDPFRGEEYGTTDGESQELIFNLMDSNERNLPQCIVTDIANAHTAQRAADELLKLLNGIACQNIEDAHIMDEGLRVPEVGISLFLSVGQSVPVLSLLLMNPHFLMTEQTRRTT
jgi:3-hydroxybutyryl-CoA dehydrogenase